MIYYHEDCFSYDNGECDCLKEIDCVGCAFYKPACSVNMGEILRIRFMERMQREKGR